jgi:hypothetical protein
VAGTSDLTRVAAIYLACIAFAVAYLLTTAFGGGGLTAAFRGGVVAGCALVVGRLVIGPVMSSIVDAMAQDAARRQADSTQEGE